MAQHTGLMLGAIADDVTGATDLALTLARGGMNVRQIVGVPENPTVFGDADAVVVSLKSRTIAKADAVAQSLASARVLLDAGAQQIFFKYCSTFDSTDAGNIGPVIDALLDLLGENRTLACPAFPTNKRTVYKGHLFVGDVLLSDSSMKDHPLTPMRDANLVRVLQRQTELNVSLIDISSVRAGPAALKTELDSLRGIAIVDALDDADLRAIGAASVDFKLITGGSGIALGLPENFSGADRGSQVKDTASVEGLPVVLAGSCSEATRRQISAATSAGMPGYKLDPIEIVAGRQTLDAALRFAKSALPHQVPVIYASATPEEVARNKAKLGPERAGTVIEDFLANLGVQLVESGFHRFIIAGGESSGAVINALGITALDIGPEIDPGVPWMTSQRRGTQLAFALKSGNFGADNIFLDAWNKL